MRGGKLAFGAQICVACKYVLSRQPRRFLTLQDCISDIELSKELPDARQEDFSHPQLHQRAQETCPRQPWGQNLERRSSGVRTDCPISVWIGDELHHARLRPAASSARGTDARL
ncbi:uncharacterized [Tachysurus ichikawai]